MGLFTLVIICYNYVIMCFKYSFSFTGLPWTLSMPLIVYICSLLQASFVGCAQLLKLLQYVNKSWYNYVYIYIAIYIYSYICSFYMLWSIPFWVFDVQNTKAKMLRALPSKQRVYRRPCVSLCPTTSWVLPTASPRQARPVGNNRLIMGW